MKKLLILSGVAVAMIFLADLSSASAQAYQGGYQFGTGFRFGRGRVLAPNLGFGLVRRPVDDIPYFAKHPPVYYSHPVPRPYGFSPYALPPGIAPAEPMTKPEPKRVVNPHFNAPSPDEPAPKAAPPLKEEPAKKASFQRTATRWIPNPYYNPASNAF